MKQFGTAALAVALSLGPLGAPALADGAASTRNTFFASAAAAVGGAFAIGNINRKKRLKRAEAAEQDRRVASYKAYVYHTYGFYPTPDEVSAWYQHTYGGRPT